MKKQIAAGVSEGAPDEMRKLLIEADHSAVLAAPVIGHSRWSTLDSLDNCAFLHWQSVVRVLNCDTM